MSVALELIVESYVRLKDRAALAALKVHREGLLAELQARTGWFDLTQPINQMQEDIQLIEAGLAKLDAVPTDITTVQELPAA